MARRRLTDEELDALLVAEGELPEDEFRKTLSPEALEAYLQMSKEIEDRLAALPDSALEPQDGEDDDLPEGRELKEGDTLAFLAPPDEPDNG